MEIIRLPKELPVEPKCVLVPTMGALHEGHLSLIRCASEMGPVVTSIFVNPTQFNDPADYEAYRRSEDADAKLAEEAGCDFLFIPSVEAMYPYGTQATVTVHVPEITEKWEGSHRPGHFDGVTTVVAKLFNMVRPKATVFGSKDWQQCMVVRRMIADLGYPIEMVIGDTVREPDGLAMSSRNERLSIEGRTRAIFLFQTLTNTAEAFREGKPMQNAVTELLDHGFQSVDYIATVDAHSLDPVQKYTGNERVIAAATIDGVRLIDNVPV
ncbi:MAG TPA: pantoate--beta-alanine ligase [Fimbriimonadales bacterium]|nr:pantoate--beta-alanine ligase [Fimbriimonadales bacterium]